VRGGGRVSGARDCCGTERSTYRRAGARMLIPSYHDLQRAFFVRLEALTGGECRGKCRGTLCIHITSDGFPCGAESIYVASSTLTSPIKPNWKSEVLLASDSLLFAQTHKEISAQYCPKTVRCCPKTILTGRSPTRSVSNPHPTDL
jgi:hypothetical protein